MKIKSISYKSNLPSLWDKILPWLLSPLIILLGIIVILWLPLFFIYIFIKEKIFKIKDEEPDTLEIECILFENEKFKIVVKESEEPDFIYDYFDEIYLYDEGYFTIYQIIDEKSQSDLGGCYINSCFGFITEHHLYLQKITQKEDEVKTYLISFEMETGKVEIIKEIGQYILVHYDEKTKTITGFGKDDNIKIELEWT